jgi:hypothetical protein
MDALSWKVRIIVLWLISAEAYSAHMMFVTIDPVSMQKMLSWGAEIDAGGWLFGAIYYLIPFWLIFTTLLVHDQASRWANFIFGIIATLLNVFHFFMCGVPIVFPILFSQPTWHHSLLLASAVAATALIIWYAWKRPKQEA